MVAQSEDASKILEVKGMSDKANVMEFLLDKGIKFSGGNLDNYESYLTVEKWASPKFHFGRRGDLIRSRMSADQLLASWGSMLASEAYEKDVEKEPETVYDIIDALKNTGLILTANVKDEDFRSLKVTFDQQLQGWVIERQVFDHGEGILDWENVITIYACPSDDSIKY
jgi:hypothetical protein